MNNNTYNDGCIIIAIRYLIGILFLSSLISLLASVGAFIYLLNNLASKGW